MQETQRKNLRLQRKTLPMDKNQQPGIGIDSIHLIECHAKILNLEAKLEYNIGLTDLSRKEEADTLIVLASFDLMHEVTNPPCMLKCTLMAAYNRTKDSSMTWAQFSDVMAVTHMIPYVRELASSVTLRMPLKPLVIPPTNVHLLVARHNERASPKPQIEPQQKKAE